LEWLSIDNPIPFYRIEIVGFVEKFCRQIKRLEITGADDTVRESISKCIISYGTQLERVLLHLLTEEKLLRIKSACPQTRIELYIDDTHLAETVEAVQIVGSELEIVHVRYPSEKAEKQEDWSGCINIQKAIFLAHVGVHDVENLFLFPKYRLKSLELAIFVIRKNKKKVISTIARGTGGLEVFSGRTDRMTARLWSW